MRLAVLIVVLILSLMFIAARQQPQPPRSPSADVSGVLDALHDAASKADGQRYFELFAPDAVFLGTDATERWPIEDFKTYAMKRFETGTGWTYRLKDNQRFITVFADNSIAWFDELLENAKYGTCRGSGVLRHVDGQWKIAQYNLSIPIPNELALDVVKMIREKDNSPMR